jgi:hypothetical protein
MSHPVGDCVATSSKILDATLRKGQLCGLSGQGRHWKLELMMKFYPDQEILSKYGSVNGSATGTRYKRRPRRLP